MRKWITAISGMTAGLMITASAWACPMHGGTISQIDPETNRLTVVKGDDMATFRIPEQGTELTLNGQKASVSDLKPGDMINVNYDTNEEVVSIEVTRQG